MPKSQAAGLYVEPVIETNIDILMKLLQGKKSVSFSDIAKELKWSISSIEKVGKALEAQGLLRLEYPSSFLQSPKAFFLKALQQPSETFESKQLVDSYGFEVDFVPAKVFIFYSETEKRPEYNVQIPTLGVYTQVFLDSLKDNIAKRLPVELAEITDIARNSELKQKFLAIVKQELLNYLSDFSDEALALLAGNLLHSMYGLGKIELLLADPLLEEVAINSAKTPVTVYHRKHGWMKTNIQLSTEEEVANYSSQVGRKVGREINNLFPILDAHLVTGDRVNATLFPISSFGNTITIRRFARTPWTMVDLIGKSNALSTEIAAMLWQAVQFEMSILVAGGTASGKTSMLNALCSLIPSYHRIISIEDVREIELPDYLKWNWVPLTTRNPNPEGVGEVSMLDLMQSSLRMRPDRLILGEVRKQREAEVLFEALHTGHSVYSTLHADSSRQALRRLTEAPISIPPLEVEAIDLIAVQYRDRRTNVRKTFEISELEAGSTEQQLEVNTVFKYSVRDDSWQQLNQAAKYLQQLNVHTGMTSKEVSQDLALREEILDWMLVNGFGSINNVGEVMREFYSNASGLQDAVEKKISPQKHFGFESGKGG
ncbi:MAG TPA: type II/IV secretion system ATPase subunit [Candidatus Diapherotrites archaeon]|uniref:Type II/IV secretion system ATPase subunit n=2 Tax=Candidatus Iainarchaeum sp. TaxID=3101447 RepID=A0A7J4KXN5_9ARCH|nr:type II/IV secretion system ATPase subunit [Candidatus Diapherotrites archaeon]